MTSPTNPPANAVRDAAVKMMMAALEQASSELENRQDCDHDGPDWAMRLKTEVDDAIAAAKAAGITGNL